MLDIDTSLLSQAALEVYIHSGMFAHHRKIIRSRYAARMEVVQEQLEAYSDFEPFRAAPRTGGNIRSSLCQAICLSVPYCPA